MFEAFRFGIASQAVLVHLRDQPHRGLRREDVRPAARYSDEVVLRGALQFPTRPRRARGPAATYSASSHMAMPLMVIDVFIFSSGMPSKSTWKSSRELIGTPTLPTSGRAIGSSVVAALRGQVERDAQAGLPFSPSWTDRAHWRPWRWSGPRRCG